MGLTADQVKMVREIWKLTKADQRTHAQMIFIRLFQSYPAYQKVFKDFADVPVDQLRDQRKFKGHALTVYYSISSCIGVLDDEECMGALINKIAKNHQPRGVGANHFSNIFEISAKYLEEALGSNIMTPQALEAWKAFGLTFIKYMNVSE